MNVETKTVEDSFHHYVRPTKYPQLDSYCISLTGITQSMVNDEETFPSVFLKFKNWLEKNQREKGLRLATPYKKTVHNGINAAFCSWSNWDLQFFFRKELNRAKIYIEPHFRTWIDVRCLYDVSSTNFYEILLDSM